MFVIEQTLCNDVSIYGSDGHYFLLTLHVSEYHIRRNESDFLEALDYLLQFSEINYYFRSEFITLGSKFNIRYFVNTRPCSFKK